MSFYNEGSRRLQDTFESRRLADRLEEVTVHDTFSEDDKQFVERSPMFFLATADRDGWPDCSYKGGLPGFARVTGPKELAFPSYDGNGMFRSLGNIVVNPKVGLLFVDFGHPFRMRIKGTASIHEDDDLLQSFEGAQLIVRVEAEAIFPNCPRYIHRMELTEASVYVPRADYVPPVPDWKKADVFRDYVPPDRAPGRDDL